MNEYPPDADTIWHEQLNESFNFIKGLNILRKYASDSFDILVTDIAVMSVSGLQPISEADLEALHKLGWEAGIGSSTFYSWAEYSKLRYRDE